MPSHYGRRFDRLCRKLRSLCPIENKVSIRTRAMADLGCCYWYDDDSIEVVIARGLSYQLAAETLVHEWAHAIQYSLYGDSDHGPEWGLIYADVYRVIIGEEHESVGRRNSSQTH